MALDMQQEITRHQKGWDAFVKATIIGTAHVIVLLVIMALTLL